MLASKVFRPTEGSRRNSCDCEGKSRFEYRGLSIGSGHHTSACDHDSRKTAIDKLLDEGIATVIAAGNDSYNAGVSEPACISSAFTVGSTTKTDSVSDFTNRGAMLDVFAPGSDIESAVSVITDDVLVCAFVVDNCDGYGEKGGTSMAAPQVTGALAVLREAYQRRRPCG